MQDTTTPGTSETPAVAADQPATEADVLALLNWQFMNELIIAKLVIIKSASSYGSKSPGHATSDVAVRDISR